MNEWSYGLKAEGIYWGFFVGQFLLLSSGLKPNPMTSPQSCTVHYGRCRLMGLYGYCELKSAIHVKYTTDVKDLILS